MTRTTRIPTATAPPSGLVSARSRLAACVLVALTLLGVLALGRTTTPADPPSNDAFPGASIAGASGSVAGFNTLASKEAGEPDHAGVVGSASVWYSWVAPYSGRFKFATCGSNFDTLLAIYTGLSVSSLTSIVSNNDGCGVQSSVGFDAIVDTTYAIAIDGVGTAMGSIVLEWQPANNDFADAQVIAGASGSVTGSNIGADREPPDEPNHVASSGAASIWYQWTAPSTGGVTFDTCGSDFDTLLAVYTGTSLSTLAEVAANDDRCGLQSGVSFAASAGTVYSIAIDGFGGASGSTVLTWATVLNDDLANAQVISGSSGSLVSSNAGATKETGEPDHAGVAGSASLWFSWTAPSTGKFIFHTCDSDFDTLLAVYTGTTFATLAEVAANNDNCGIQSSVNFAAIMGTTYKIAVDGNGMATGLIGLAWQPVPANDDFANAAVITAVSGTAAGNNRGATMEPGEPSPILNAGGASVWYAWTAPVTATFTFDTCASGTDFNTLLAVYTGGPVGSLGSPVASSDDDCGVEDVRSSVTFAAVGGTTYHIVVDGGYCDCSTVPVGDFVLTWRSAAMLPALSINDVSVTEGNVGTTTATFTVTSSAVVPFDVSVQVTSGGGTATPGTDYAALSTVTVTIPETTSPPTATVTVTIFGDFLVEPDETFFLNLTNPTNATIEDGLGVGTILNDDAPPPTTTTTTVSSTTTTLGPTTTTTVPTTIPTSTTTTVGPTTTTTVPTTVPTSTTTTVGPTTTTTTALPPTTTTTIPDEPEPPTTVTTTPPTTTTIAPTTTTVPTTTTIASTTTSAPPTTTVPSTTTPTTAPPAGTSTTVAVTTLTTLAATPSTTVPSPSTTAAPPTTPSTTTAPPTTTTPPTTTAPTTTAPPPPATITARNPDGQPSGPPGVGLDVSGGGYSDCSTVYFFFDGVRIGSDTPDATGSVGVGKLSVPGDAGPGQHRVTSSCRTSGGPVRASTDFLVTDASIHRSAFATSLPEPGQVSLDLRQLATSAVVAIGFLLLFAFPFELFNSTVEENYDELRGWFRLPARAVEASSRASRALTFFGLTVITGIVIGFLSPDFGLNLNSLVLVAGYSVALLVMSLGFSLPAAIGIYHRTGEWGKLNFLPGTVLISILMVAASRLLHFQPGYFYGSLAGLAFASALTRMDQGRLTAANWTWALVLSVGAWLARIPVSEAAAQPGASALWIGLEACLVMTFLWGVEGLAVAMLPMRFLDGRKVIGWNRVVWAVLMFLGVFTTFHVLLSPSSGYVGQTSGEVAIGVVVLFLVFGAVSVGLWAYFRFRPERLAPHPGQ